MKSFVVNEKDNHQRLDQFITRTVPLLPQTLMYKYIRTKRIKINGQHGICSTRLNSGDIVELYINNEFFEKPPPKYEFLQASANLNIIYEDENIILCDKAVGILSHPNDSEQTDTLIGRIKRYLYEKGEYNPDMKNVFEPSLVNRIDRNTGGIVIAAKNAEALTILNQKMKNRELRKFYLCVVHGILSSQSETLNGYLVKDRQKNRVFVSKKKRNGSKEIRTKYRLLGSGRNLSLVEVELLTGRTHQIRAHFAAIGHPLLGDGKYGTNAQNAKYGYNRQLLYSYKLVFDFTTDAGKLEYLNHREFEAGNVWFKNAFYAGAL